MVSTWKFGTPFHPLVCHHVHSFSFKHKNHESIWVPHVQTHPKIRLFIYCYCCYNIYIYIINKHTLDKNGSLYDPAGTESWNMQIRYETTKLTKHPTNNRSSPEWFPCPRSSSKIIDRRCGFDKIIQIHRRHGFGEIIQKIKILSATWFRRKYWGRFWCSWTNRKWPNLIPDCDNSAANCITLLLGF